ncbi:glycosyltransferase [Arthrobacter sp. TMP15]|uniref:glycosyltransferase n=1 Tax=Arthrobacter sp. TMP15 TaxID=3140789 RepID=UPI0031BA59FA
MKILVYPHDMAIGGSQLNAIELAAAVKGLGHEVVVYGQNGPLVDKVKELGLEFLPSPAVHRRPTPGIVRDLRRIVKKHGIDVVHAYEWPPSLEAALACTGKSPAVAVSTVMSMSVAPFIPKHLSLLVGTKQIADLESKFGRAHMGLLEPPVDTVLNSSEAQLDMSNFLAQVGADPEVFTVSIVSRLAHEMKLEGILYAIAAVEEMNKDAALQLVIAGDGPALEDVRTFAQRANSNLGVQRIFLVGELTDPRSAYDCADVSIGMGGSALRAMAFGLPLVVQGESGFWSLLSEESAPTFLWQGWYGAGPGAEDAVSRLVAILTPLLTDQHLRSELGSFARKLVVERYSLEQAALRQLQFYEEARSRPPMGVLALARHWGASSARFGRYKQQQLTARFLGNHSRDDFNAQPVLKSGTLPVVVRG